MDTKEAELRQKIEQALEEMRGALRGHGGDVELVDIKKDAGMITVRLHGACAGCPLSEMTLKQGIEDNLRAKLPWIKEVREVK